VVLEDVEKDLEMGVIGGTGGYVECLRPEEEYKAWLGAGTSRGW
jgi:hypothetical protein